MILVGRMQKLQGYPPVSSHWQWNILIFNGEYASNTSSKSPFSIASLSLPAQLTSRAANGLPLRSFEIGNSGFLDWKSWGIGRQSVLICDCLKMWKQHQMFDVRKLRVFFACSHVWVKFWKLPWYLYGVVCFWHTGEISRESWFETQHISWGKSGMLGLCLFCQMNPQGNQWTWVQWKLFWVGPGWRITHLKFNIDNSVPRKQRKIFLGNTKMYRYMRVFLPNPCRPPGNPPTCTLGVASNPRCTSSGRHLQWHDVSPRRRWRRSRRCFVSKRLWKDGWWCWWS